MKTFNTDSLTVDDLQSDISLWDHKRICEFFSSPSLSPFSFLETTAALKNALGKEENKRRRQMRNRQKNRAKTFSLLLLKEKGAAVGEGAPIGGDKTAERKTLSFPFNADGTCPDR